MAITADDVLRVTARFVKDTTNEVFNTFAWGIPTIGSGDQSDAIDTIGHWLELLYANYDLAMSDTVDYQDYNVFNRTQNAPYGNFAWPTQTSGGGGGSPLPNQNAAYSFARTATNGIIARKYLPVTTEDNQADGVLVGDAAAGVAGFLLDWIDTYTDPGTGMQMIPGVIRSVGLGAGSLAPIISGVYRLYQHTLRNRRPGVGS